MDRYFVYLLECADGSYYTGVTNNMEVRLQQHQNGIDTASYTYPRRPITLVYRGDFREITDAIAWEKQLKGWSRKKKKALIKGDEVSLHKLAECMNETHYKSRSSVIPSEDEG